MLVRILCERRLRVDETLILGCSEFGRTPWQDLTPRGRGHHSRCFTCFLAGGGVKPGFSYGVSDHYGDAPAENPVHPGELLATIYHAFGIDPGTIVYNHLNQPRELVKADAVTNLFG